MGAEVVAPEHFSGRDVGVCRPSEGRGQIGLELVGGVGHADDMFHLELGCRFGLSIILSQGHSRSDRVADLRAKVSPSCCNTSVKILVQKEAKRNGGTRGLLPSVPDVGFTALVSVEFLGVGQDAVEVDRQARLVCDSFQDEFPDFSRGVVIQCRIVHGNVDA